MHQPDTHFGGVVGILEAGLWRPTLLEPWFNLTPSPIMFPFHLQTTQTTTMTTKVRVGWAGPPTPVGVCRESEQMPCHPLPATEVSPRPPEEQFQSQQQVPQEVIPAPTPGNAVSLSPATCVPQDGGAGFP